VKKILIYNRGEIALRAVMAAKSCNLHSVIILEEGDFTKLLESNSNEAIISKHKSIYTDLDFLDSFLENNTIDYLYPGYGYLSEDPKLEILCKKHNVCFIGPNSHCLSLLSDKKLAGDLFNTWGVNTLALKSIKDNDYPIMLKAAMGGGGRGNKVVQDSTHYQNALTKLKKKSKQLFHNDTILCERYLPSARHIEVQVFATKEKVSIIGSRDCSLQINYQKVIEEGPASHDIKNKLEEYYSNIEKGLKELGYVGFGTIEFLWDNINQEFYFLEMNTRIQVEHTVTEELLSHDKKVDLIQDQINIFNLNNLTKVYTTEQGHAINLRLYAVDPEHDFTPCHGLLHYIEIGNNIRFDHSITVGESVSMQFDPLLGKLISKGANRQECIKQAIKDLKSIKIHGVKTNSAYLLAILNNELFNNDKHDISFLESNHNDIYTNTLPLESSVISDIRLLFNKNNLTDRIEYHNYNVTLAPNGVLWIQDIHTLNVYTENFYPSLSRGDKSKSNQEHVTSPVTGIVREIIKAPYDIIEKGDVIFTVESMKMFFEVEAPKSGILQEFTIKTGSSVNSGEILIRID
jgi:acetyl/propionyl-CoA carboxylase alpha subunit